MRALSYSLVKISQLQKLQKDVSTKDAAISSATEFVKEIAKGNLDTTYNVKKDYTDALATSLVEMRDQMKRFASEEKQRNWVTEGLASFVEILRSNGNDFAGLADNIIRQLVKYMNVNQGALYLINDDDHPDSFLEMVACFAYNRKKHLNQRINLGEGIIGQVVLEKSTTYMKDIPKDYLKITSGLGEALPKNLLIVPLKLDDTVFGAVELASFETIEPYHIHFVEKLGESIASTISAVKVSQRTHRLLQETQQQTEEMKSQEEEMRQNMEELSATQEEMHRILREVQDQERYMKDMINSSKDSILTVDRDYKVTNYNKALAESYAVLGITIEKGFEMRHIFSAEEWPKYQAHYERAFKGENFEVAEHYHSHGFDSYFVINYSPLRNEKGDVIAAAVFAKDSTQLIKANQDAKEQQRYYNDVIEGMADCVLTIDKDYKIVVANKAFKKLFSRYGLNVEPGADLLAITQGDKKKEEEFKKPYIKALAGEHVEEPHRHHFDIDFQVSYRPLRDTLGNVIGVCLVAHDITQRLQSQKQTETLLYESQHHLEEVRSQEEELRQNMEEMQAIQEELARNGEELERVRKVERERAETQINAQKKIMTTVMEKFKSSEQEYKARIAMLEEKLKQVA